MGIFGKKEKTTCNCSCCNSAGLQPKTESTCCGETVKGICCIKVLGAGCASCHKQYENVKQAVANLALSVEAEYVTDLAKVMEYGVMSMPAIVANEKVVAMGKVLSVAEVEKLLSNF